jgi:hypothetical protein
LPRHKSIVNWINFICAYQGQILDSTNAPEQPLCGKPGEFPTSVLYDFVVRDSLKGAALQLTPKA